MSWKPFSHLLSARPIFPWLSAAAILHGSWLMASGSEPDPDGPDYVTSSTLETDKLASMWLIQRWIQPGATFRFLAEDDSPGDGIPFDSPDSEFRRTGTVACFEKILKRFDVSDPALIRIGDLIHDIEINYWGEKRYSESVDLDRAIMDTAMAHAESPEACKRAAFSVLEEWYLQIRRESSDAAGRPGSASANVERLQPVTPMLYVGGQPEGDAAFAQLQDLGVRTIISVDGATPDAARARAHGMRYVHLPIGYTDVSRAKVLRIIKAAECMPGPVLIHCHRGQHRAPTAAALVAITTDAWSNEQGVRFMEASGTSAQYPYLYDLVKGFDPPSADELHSVEDEFPEVADVGSLAKIMARIDVHWSHLEATRQAEFVTPEDHPDLNPKHEAKILHDLFVQASDMAGDTVKDPDFASLMAEAATSAGVLLKDLEDLPPNRTRDELDQVGEAFAIVGGKCAQCHRRFRGD